MPGNRGTVQLGNKASPVVFMLLQRKYVLVKELLKFLVCIVDVKLFESVSLNEENFSNKLHLPCSICNQLTKYHSNNSKRTSKDFEENYKLINYSN